MDNLWPEVALLAIYKIYPRKIAKPRALNEIRHALNRICQGEIDGGEWTQEDALEYLRERTQEAQAAFSGREPRFIPHPATYYHQSRYLSSTPRQADGVTRLEDCIAILQLHPRFVGREDAIKKRIDYYMPAVMAVELALNSLESTHGKIGAKEYLAKRTSLYASYVADWPDEERRYISGMENFYRKRVFEQDERCWIKTKRPDYNDERNQIQRILEQH
jgi:hypothetical protein